MVHISQGDSKTELGTQFLLQASPSVSKHGPQLAVSALPEFVRNEDAKNLKLRVEESRMGGLGCVCVPEAGVGEWGEVG